MPRTVLTPPAGGSPMPDIPNWAWHEYGNRVGFWRMLEVFDRFKIRAVLAINGVARSQPIEPIARAALERGLGIHGPWLRPEEHAEGSRRARRHRENDRTPSRRSPGAAARLARARADRNLGHAGHPRGGRLRIRLRLGARRSAGHAEDAQQADRQRALYAGVQRRRDDADSAPQGRRNTATARSTSSSSCIPTRRNRRG